MKRIFALVIICALALCVFVACDKESPTETPTSAPTEAPTSAPTEAPTSVPTEAPTTVPTESTVDRETVKEKLLAANQYIENNPNFKVDVTSENIYEGEMAEGMGGETMTTTQTVIFTSTGYKSEQNESDGSFDNYTLIDGVLYNHYSIEGEESKTKTLFSQEDYDLFLADLRTEYMYEGEFDMFDEVTVLDNGDGTVTYIFKGYVADASEDEDSPILGTVTNMAMEITLDGEGRFISIVSSVEMTVDMILMTLETTTLVVCEYTYCDEGELEITAPEDADTYEEMVEEEWSCDCGASSWEDCVCEYEWSCDCGATSWEDCVCEYEWSCDCGATSWEDCVCEYEWSCDCGATSWEDCICE